MKPAAELLPPPSDVSRRQLDLQSIRADFPILGLTTRGYPLIYLDSGATTQKPRQVIDAINRYYELQNANIHRGVYHLSQLATSLYEQGRAKVRGFLNARYDEEIIFTRGTTESINLVAASFGQAFLKPGDEILVSAMEHHSNIVPWQLIAQRTGAKLRVIPINDDGELLLDQYAAAMLGPKLKIVSVVHASNSLGTINDIKTIAKMAHAVGAKVLADGAQWVAHAPTDVQDLDVDFYAFSGHKLYGPTGIGVLYGKREILDQMPPYQGGGDMIESVSFENTTYAPLPNKFEAGTPDIAGVVGLAAAIDYLESIGFAQITPHERDLFRYATSALKAVPGLRIVGNASQKSGVISFVLEDPSFSSLDIGIALDRRGIAIRTGHHCCQPVMNRLNIPSTARISLAIYNTRSDIDAAVNALKELVANVPKPLPATNTQTVDYPKPSAASPRAAADALTLEFELLGDRDAQVQYLLDMGQTLPRYFDLLKQVTPRVPGCMSEVYLVARRSPESPDALDFIADANAEIVRGLIALLQRILAGQRAAEILAFDFDAFFRRIGLDQFISSQRRTGLAGMIARLRTEAELLVRSNSRP